MNHLDYYNRKYLREDQATFTIGEKVLCQDSCDSRDADTIEQFAVYLGHLSTSHYGNFLFDNLCRLWYVVDNQIGGGVKNSFVRVADLTYVTILYIFIFFHISA